MVVSVVQLRQRPAAAPTRDKYGLERHAAAGTAARRTRS
jgi:hypothetical protein